MKTLANRLIFKGLGNGKESSSAHQGCIYLTKNTRKTELL